MGNCRKFKCPVTLTLTLDRVEVKLVRICGRGLPTHQIRWKLEKFFVDVRTDTPEFQSTRSSVGDDLKIAPLLSPQDNLLIYKFWWLDRYGCHSIDIKWCNIAQGITLAKTLSDGQRQNIYAPFVRLHIVGCWSMILPRQRRTVTMCKRMSTSFSDECNVCAWSTRCR